MQSARWEHGVKEIHPQVVSGASSQVSLVPLGPEGREGRDSCSRGSSREGRGREEGQTSRATPRQPEQSQSRPGHVTASSGPWDVH